MVEFTRPVFIVSAPRSGSTLLRLIMDAHPNIAIPPPCWLFELVFPYLFSYGDLSEKSNFESLIEDVLETPTIKNWPIKFSVQELSNEVPERTFGALVDAMHRQYARSQGKGRWGEKSPRDCFWIDEIRQNYPDAQFVHIIRDGRDQAIDIAESPTLMPFNIYAGAEMWRLFVSAVLDSANSLDKQNYYEIHYEKMCAEPENQIRQLCEFLKEDFDESMLHHHETKSSATWGSKPGHQKAARPITTEYCEMHKTLLGDEDRITLDGIIGDLLKRFGYPVSEIESNPLDPRLVSQLRGSDTVSSLRNAAYKEWHQRRRIERREAGVWDVNDRKSLLWGLS